MTKMIVVYRKQSTRVTVPIHSAPLRQRNSYALKGLVHSSNTTQIGSRRIAWTSLKKGSIANLNPLINSCLWISELHRSPYRLPFFHPNIFDLFLFCALHIILSHRKLTITGWSYDWSFFEKNNIDVRFLIILGLDIPKHGEPAYPPASYGDGWGSCESPTAQKQNLPFTTQLNIVGPTHNGHNPAPVKIVAPVQEKGISNNGLGISEGLPTIDTAFWIIPFT